MYLHQGSKRTLLGNTKENINLDHVDIICSDHPTRLRGMGARAPLPPFLIEGPQKNVKAKGKMKEKEEESEIIYGDSLLENTL